MQWVVGLKLSNITVCLAPLNWSWACPSVCNIRSIQVAKHEEDEAPNIQGTIIGGCYCLCYCYCLHKSAVHYYSTILVTSSRGGGGGRAQYTGDWCWLLLTDTSSPSANLSPPSYYQHSSDEEQMNTKWALDDNLKHVSCCKQCWTILW